MKRLKQYGLPLLTLLLAVLGGAMPWLAGRVQDERMGALQERFDLDAVSLTLRQDSDFRPALRVVSGECTSIPWKEETQLTEQDALSAAVSAISQMNEFGLLAGRETIVLTQKTSGWAEPFLLVGKDGSSALAWNCYWENGNDMVLVDDASGKAVAFLVGNPSPPAKEDADLVPIDRWGDFFQAYYGIEVANTEDLLVGLTHGGLRYQYEVTSSAAAGETEGDMLEELKLDFYGDYTSFNF